MHASARRAALGLAAVVTEGLDVALAMAGGAIGAWASYPQYPDAWSSNWRLAAAGAFAVIAAAAFSAATGPVLYPLRRMTSQHRHPRGQAARPHAPAAPGTLQEALAQVATATEQDTASRAAFTAWRIDTSDDFLRDSSRWRGYEDGEATFFLSPGVWLHYCRVANGYSPTNPCFTLLTGDNDQPVPITGIEQIHHHLRARASGLPVAPAPAETTQDTITETSYLTIRHQ
ncbi:hypothetical protein [Streptomyces sp. MNP-20]|uniref:hypothetical protein n=1 Tax=Streptomyces sp. MNP-20 TaxID=2721165 RepID=UPI001556B9A0|nr:hypothetical protein [Streptomyces sp. MNP-20]